MMPTLRYKITAPHPTLDMLVTATRDLRTTSDLLPFASVSAMRLRSDPPRSIGFTIDPGYGCAQLPFNISYHDGEWSGGGAFTTGFTCVINGFPIALRLHLAVCAVLDYAHIIGFRVQAEDQTGYWDHRSFPRLVGSMDGADDFINSLNDPLRSFLLGDYKPTRDNDEVVDESLAIQPLWDFLELLREDD